jgi:hypothetical protein
MTPVAPGQWTDLVQDHEIEFEARRVDRIDVEFHQGAATEVSRATGPNNMHGSHIAFSVERDLQGTQ